MNSKDCDLLQSEQNTIFPDLNFYTLYNIRILYGYHIILELIELFFRKPIKYLFIYNSSLKTLNSTFFKILLSQRETCLTPTLVHLLLFSQHIGTDKI